MILVSVWKYFLLLENFFRISPPGQQGHLGRLSAGAGVSSVSALRTRQVSSSAEAGAAADGHGDTFLQTRQPRTWQPEQHCGMVSMGQPRQHRQLWCDKWHGACRQHVMEGHDVRTLTWAPSYYDTTLHIVTWSVHVTAQCLVWFRLGPMSSFDT